MYIIVDKQDYRIIDNIETPEIIDDKWVKSTHGSLMQLDIVDVVEIDNVPDNVQYYKGNEFYNDVPEVIESKRNIMITKLAELDLIVPRIVEDIISQGNFTIHQSKIEIINLKNEIRNQLKDLS